MGHPDICRSCPLFRQIARSQPIKKRRISPLKLSPTPCRCWLSFGFTDRPDTGGNFSRPCPKFFVYGQFRKVWELLAAGGVAKTDARHRPNFWPIIARKFSGKQDHSRPDHAPKVWAMSTVVPTRPCRKFFPHARRRSRDLPMAQCLHHSPPESTTAKPTGFCFLTASRFERHSARSQRMSQRIATWY